MKKWIALASILALTSGCQGMQSGAPLLNVGAQVAGVAGQGGASRLGGAIKQVLQLSSQRASTALARPEAFRMPLPGAAQSLADTLRQAGLGSYVEPVQNAMNQGAGQAMAEAAPVFRQAIQQLSVEDAMGIARGGDTAATRYFRANSEQALRERFAPLVTRQLEQSGFYSEYQAMLNVYEQIPMATLPDLDLERHVIDTSMDALFNEMAQQESLIRQDPLGSGGELIGQAFQRVQQGR